jgi:type IV pilus assembly protein PilV
MIDALVALLIFSFGMLALAALQNVSKQSNFEALQRTNAAMYASDLFQRMRMNSYSEGESTFPPLSYYVDTSMVMNYGELTGTTSSCATTDRYCLLALQDLTTWQNMLNGDTETNTTGNVGGLVKPTACLTGPGGGVSGEYTLTIVWRGQTKLDNQNASTCGAGTGLYDDAVADDFAYRRILVLNTYLNY